MARAGIEPATPRFSVASKACLGVPLGAAYSHSAITGASWSLRRPLRFPQGFHSVIAVNDVGDLPLGVTYGRGVDGRLVDSCEGLTSIRPSAPRSASRSSPDSSSWRARPPQSAPGGPAARPLLLSVYRLRKAESIRKRWSVSAVRPGRLFLPHVLPKAGAGELRRSARPRQASGGRGQLRPVGVRRRPRHRDRIRAVGRLLPGVLAAFRKVRRSPMPVYVRPGAPGSCMVSRNPVCTAASRQSCRCCEQQVHRIADAAHDYQRQPGAPRRSSCRWGWSFSDPRSRRSEVSGGASAPAHGRVRLRLQ